MRSTTFALLGITAAMGLGLVAIISQQSWPALPSVPLPGFSSEPGQVGDAEALVGPHPQAAPATLVDVLDGGPAAEPAASAPGQTKPEDSGVAGSRQLAVAPPSPPSGEPAAGGPPSATSPAAVPAPQPVAESPPAATPTSEPAPASPSSPSTTPPASTAGVSSPVDTETGGGDREDEKSGDDKASGEKNKGGRKSTKPPRYEPTKPTPASTPPSAADPKPNESVPVDDNKGEVKEESSQDRGKSWGSGYKSSGK